MPEANEARTGLRRRLRHRGRSSQIPIYLGKQLRFFVNESDWKVIPMSAVIAGLVSMVVRRRLFITMEGSLIGAFALVCVAIWNGCFNSIQAVCRERAIIKREHRSGMHITSYVIAHMIYQLGLCLLQTGVTVYVMKMVGVQFPARGFITPWIMLDIGITMLLISYAADMMSLFISSISRTTTSAMTIMPFVLIFQLVFSGSVIPLPAWSRPLSHFTISNYGIQVLAAQAGYNELPMMTAWNIVDGMRGREVGGTVTLGEILDELDSPGLEKYRDREVLKAYTVGEIADILSSADESLHLREKTVMTPMTLRSVLTTLRDSDVFADLRNKKPLSILSEKAPSIGEILTQMLENEEMQGLLDVEIGTEITLGKVLDGLKVAEIAAKNRDAAVNQPVTLGQVIDMIRNNEALQAQRDRSFTFTSTVGDVIGIIGEERVKDLLQNKTAEASRKPEYDLNLSNILGNWVMLGGFILLFALLATVALELIDKDKR